METKLKHKIENDNIIIDVLTNKFTHDLVHSIKTEYPFSFLYGFKYIEFNLRPVKMIDSSSIGFLFDLHNKIKANNKDAELIISVVDNNDLRELLHKFQVDLLLNVK